MALADAEDAVIRLTVRPGDFLYRGRQIASIWFVGDGCTENADEQMEQTFSDRLNKTFIIGAERTHIQDVRHAFDELVEIAVRALSPGVNDPFTAINCIDRIHAALNQLKNRRIPSRYRANEDSVLRVIADPFSMEECVQGSLGVIDNYTDGSPSVKDRIAEVRCLLTKPAVQ